MAAAAHATREAKIEGKNKSYKEKRQANVWRTRRHWQVASVCSKCTFLGDQWRHCILQTRFLLQPRASDSSKDSAIVYEYVRQSLIYAHCIDKCHHMCKSGAILFSINCSWTLLPLMRSWCTYSLYVALIRGTHIKQYSIFQYIRTPTLFTMLRLSHSVHVCMLPRLIW